MEVAIIVVVLFLIMIVIKVPIAISIGLASMVGCMIVGYNMAAIGGVANSALASSTIMCVPAYIFAGCIMSRGGIAKNLIACLRAWLGHIPGGMAIVAVIGCAFFAAITGSAVATIAAVGGLMIPAMTDARYTQRFSMGLIAGGGCTGILIPPSIPMILYAVIAGVSVKNLFLAGFAVGGVVAIAFAAYCVIYSVKTGQGSVNRIPIKERLVTTAKALPAIFLPVSIIGAIYGGIMTPTEAAAWACIYALVVSLFIYKGFGLKELWESLKEGAKQSSMLLFIMVSCSMFSQFLTFNRVPHMLVEFVEANNLGLFPVLALFTFLMIILGMFMDGTSITLIVSPLMVPVMTALNFDLVQFGIVMVLGIMFGLLTPPVGLSLFTVSAITKANISEVIKGAIWPMIILFALWMLSMIWPALSLWPMAFAA